MENLTPPVSLDKLSTLIPACNATAIAKSAKLYNELCSISYCINSAANTGEFCTKYLHAVSDEATAELESQGYTVVKLETAIPNTQVLISWPRE